ncbi:MAG: alpha-E domain-containing protein [Neomegalonema sp.]|nr:alpha-E domain-containing protein [Neomegalonema sp.]
MLLARHAECLYWMGRYIERAASLSGVLMTQNAFNRGRADGAGWSWVLALYDEISTYEERFGAPTAEGVVSYYLTDREHLGSIPSSIAAARANARTLRAMISTEFWIQINQAHQKAKQLREEVGLTDSGLTRACDRVRNDCYALIGAAEATFFRDAGWRFFRLGVEMERADQMSRLLDVRFAQLQTGDADAGETLGDFAFWSVLLRSCGGHHAFRRRVSGAMTPETVARFLVFEAGFGRSLTHCVEATVRLFDELELECDAPTPQKVAAGLNALTRVIRSARTDPELLYGLHGFNDRLQRRLGELTEQMGDTYFGGAAAAAADQRRAARAEARKAAERAEADSEPEQMQTQAQPPGLASNTNSR